MRCTEGHELVEVDNPVRREFRHQRGVVCTASFAKPSKPPEGASPIGRLDAEALESQRAHERDLAQPARPVEDREPVGPYAPTRDGRTLNARYEADPGLFEAGYRQGWRERDTPGSTPRYADLTVREACDESDGGEPLVTMTVGGYRAAKEAEFERGRQQGDADRAQRGQTEFERGVTMGRANREAELLDQGWTPPGAVHELEVTSRPTDYEVWRDALTLANEHGAEGVTQRARWFHQELLNGVDGGANEEDPPDDNDVQAEPRMGTGND